MKKKNKGLARINGQDLMRGEHVVGRLTPGGRGKNSAWQDGSGPRKFKGGLADGLHAEREAQKRGDPEPDFAGQESSGTSIFDPVLCELCYRWFIPKRGSILDPFAGGSVRGIVAAMLGHEYTGIDLSARQIEANRKQAEEICGDIKPSWIVGDSRTVAAITKSNPVDFVFSCPPYFDLEVYSDDPADLSKMEWQHFLEAYRAIIAACVALLKPDRFACFVVGDLRDGKGFYRNLPGETINAFQASGAALYNEAVLVTSVGSLPIRCGRQFESGRKLGKTHQNVLAFYKGDPKSIKAFGSCEFGEGEDPIE